jgi:glycosyltransferase involved in cell wall biosynthesis
MRRKPVSATVTVSPVRTGDRRRIALLTSSADGGGAQRSMARLGGAIASRGFPVDLVLGRAQGHYLEEIASSVRIVDLDASRMVAAIPALVRYLRRERPVAMLSALDYVNVVAVWSRLLARTDVRLVVSERNTLSEAVGNTTSRRSRMMPGLIRRSYPRADAIVAVSAGVADDLSQMTDLPRAGIDVIHNPVVTRSLREMAAEPLDHPWFAPGSRPVVLAAGRFVPQKDFPCLIRAFADVRSAVDARLMILGDGPGRSTLLSLADSLGIGGDLDLPGWARNPYPYMSRAGVFVLSSRWEGLPGALIEALCCGVPVVSTDCPSGPREILAGGLHGALVPVGDAAALGREIMRALTGGLARPTPDAWLPFEEGAVVERYLDVLVGTER